MVKQQHDSDCAVHNMPAYPNGPCDCGAIPLSAEDSEIFVGEFWQILTSMKPGDTVCVAWNGKGWEIV